MASLYRRASPSQRRILRAVEGAIKNACDAHPEVQISPHFRRSVAKRAAGTLTAQWPEVLAAGAGLSSASGRALTLIKARSRSSEASKAAARGALRLAKRPPWAALISELSRPIRAFKLAGEHQRAETLIDVLRTIHRLRIERVEHEVLKRAPPAESGAVDRSPEGASAPETPDEQPSPTPGEEGGE